VAQLHGGVEETGESLENGHVSGDVGWCMGGWGGG